MFIANKVLVARVLTADKVGGAGRGSKLKSVESKTGILSKSQKLAKLGKKSLKSGSLPNFHAKKNELSFLTPKTRATFNRLRLIFTKPSILWHFDPEYYIWIEIDALGYTISEMLC